MSVVRPLPSPLPPPPSESDSADLFDYPYLRNVVGSVFRGVRRHRALTAFTFVVTLALGITWMVVAPRTYHVEAKLLASRSQLIRSLGNPRSSGTPFEDPTRAAEETVFAHDNLLALIKQTHLLERIERARSLPARALGAVFALALGPPKPEEQLEALVLLLEKRLHVTSDAQTVVISIDWPEADAAYQVVETAQQNFLEARHVSEMTAISEALSILQVHAASAQGVVNAALDELERVREERRDGTSRRAPDVAELPAQRAQPAERVEVGVAPAANEQELAQLKYLLHAKRRSLQDLEEFRAKRMVELNAQLAEQRVQYAERHPTVVDTMQRIAMLAEPSPQLAQVREEVAALLEEYRRKGGVAPDSLVEPGRRVSASGGRATQQPAARVAAIDLADDPLVEFARNSLRVASANAEELEMRIDSARIEQDTARAAFKYRYSIVRPASLPTRAVAPKLEVLLALTLGAALLFALLSGAALERWRGVVAEPWQVTDRLGLPVLSAVRAK